MLLVKNPFALYVVKPPVCAADEPPPPPGRPPLYTSVLPLQVGEASNIEYRSVSGIDAYIPLVRVRELTDPLLGMDVNDLPSK